MSLGSTQILLLAKQPRQVRVLTSLLRRSRFAVAIACTEDQAILEAIAHPPFLVILTGHHRDWSKTLLRQLRDQTQSVTLIALTDFHNPSWIYQEENPGFDGFLVSPISSEVLFSLIQSAHTRQTCCSVG